MCACMSESLYEWTNVANMCTSHFYNCSVSAQKYAIDFFWVFFVVARNNIIKYEFVKKRYKIYCHRVEGDDRGRRIGIVTRKNMQNCFINTVPQVSSWGGNLKQNREKCNHKDFDVYTEQNEMLPFNNLGWKESRLV